MKLILHAFDLTLKHPFTISRRSFSSQASLVVELQYQGFSGFGEATANPYYNVTVESMTANLEVVKELVYMSDLSDEPADFWLKVSVLLKENMFALCALDQAYHDLFTKNKGLKLYEFWNYKIDKIPQSDYTIGIDTIEKMVAKMTERPWPIYKIKLGTKEDIAIVKELRKHTDAVFRIDANCGWTAEEAIKNALELKKLGVEFLEQPLKATDWEGAKKLYENTVLPIIADESCIVEADVEKCAGYFHGVNIKLMKCGGLTPARRMLKKAKELGLKTMVGCMTESTVGVSAIAHLLPELDYVDMDGALLLSKDIATGVTINKGDVSFSDLNGTGVALL
ncbi:MAG: dipeptide epimerase [Flavobacteriaceae bacterium]|nr:MAG: dipeptide epimerase [Flavobacteriaceae bacterium]